MKQTKTLLAVAMLLVWLMGCTGGSTSGVSDTPDFYVYWDPSIWHYDISEDVQDISETSWEESGSAADGVLQLDKEQMPDSSPFVSCQTGADCESGICLTLEDNSKVCAIQCLGDESCPEGYECRAVKGTGSDVVFVCVPFSQRLCRPCNYNEDCSSTSSLSNDVCVDFGPDGHFCGKDCSLDGRCPEGYTCKEVFSTGSQTQKFMQCVPSEGECKCTSYFIQNGFKTTCYRENEYGKCFGERVCTEEGLTACSAQVPRPEECNGKDENCNGQTDDGIAPRECEKEFGEFVCKGPEVCEGGEWVCKAQEPSEEKCDGIDNDCDGLTDPEGVSGCVQYYIDGDRDGYGSGNPRCLCGSDPPYAALLSGDCDDGDPDVNPDKKEICNGVDDDCDGATDEEGAMGCRDYFKDSDGDGYGVPGDKKCLCDAVFPYMATQAGDCDDGDASVHPQVEDICNDKDDDCDGVKDPEGALGCMTFYYDGDNDGWGVQDNFKCLCAPFLKYTANRGGDCNDFDPAINPGAVELCGNGKDDNCNGFVDEENASGCQIYYADKDNDSYGDPTDFKCLCAPQGSYRVFDNRDCNDNDPTINPATAESCNGKDDNCNGQIDEENALGCSYYYYDGDNDGYGIGSPKCLCFATGSYRSTRGDDCDDNDASVNPGRTEVCSNGKDDDCDRSVDENQENAVNCRNYYYDGDNDTYGTSAYKCYCSPYENYRATRSGDCNDNDASVNPGKTEVCNNQKDDDCDGSTDENQEGAVGCTNFYQDNDSDTYGSNTYKCFCAPSGSYRATRSGDCNDDDNTIYPNATEQCDNKDNNCNGTTDEGFENDDLAPGWGDLPSHWPGPNLYNCTGSCSGQFSGRLLPQGDVDWVRVWKKESNNWIVSLEGRVIFNAPSGKQYKVCICWSRDSFCDESSQVCGTYSGSQVDIRVENEDSWGKDDAAYLDIQISPVGSSDYGCGFYTVSWSVWE